MTITLPWPPSVNRLWRNVGNRTLLSAAGRTYKANVEAVLFATRLRPLVGRLAVVVEVYPPDRRKRDIDNSQKAVLDAVAGPVFGLYLDDSQIDDLRVRRMCVVPGGKVVLTVTEIGGEP